MATFIWEARLDVCFVHPKIGLSERASLCLVCQEVETTKTEGSSSLAMFDWLAQTQGRKVLDEKK